jgi:hypothetical protein
MQDIGGLPSAGEKGVAEADEYEIAVPVNPNMAAPISSLESIQREISDLLTDDNDFQFS